MNGDVVVEDLLRALERVMRRCGIVGLHLRKKVRTTIPEPSHQLIGPLRPPVGMPKFARKEL